MVLAMKGNNYARVRVPEIRTLSIVGRAKL